MATAEGWRCDWKRNRKERNGVGGVAPKGQPRYFLFQAIVPLIQARLWFGRVESVLITPARSVFFRVRRPRAYLSKAVLYKNHFAKSGRVCQGNGDKTLRHSRIASHEAQSSLRTVMRAMGNKRGDGKVEQRGGKARMVPYTEERETELARKAGPN